MNLLFGDLWPCFAAMFEVLWKIVDFAVSLRRSKRELALENLALRHQIEVLKGQTRKPKLRRADRLGRSHAAS